MAVRVGSSLYSTDGTKVSVDRFRQHEGYDDEELDNDISILILECSLEFNNRIKSIELATEEGSTGSVATVSGWGAFLPPLGLIPLNAIPNILLSSAGVNLIGQSECKESGHEAYKEITEQMICAGTNGTLLSTDCKF